MPPFQHIDRALTHGILVVTIKTPELRSLKTSQELRTELTAAAEENASEKIIVNFSEVTFVGSVSILSILALRRLEFVEKIVLCHLTPPIHEVFDMCRLISNDNNQTAPFKVASTTKDALVLLQSED